MSKGTTIFFDIDISDVEGNPHRIETPFGLPQIIAKGNVLQRHDQLEAALMDACERLEKAGFPAPDLEACLCYPATKR